MDQQEVIDLLQNDVKIVDRSGKRRDTAKDLHYLVFPRELMPDNREFVGEVPEKLDPSILKEWCNAVRREWSARYDRKTAEEKNQRDAADALDAASRGGTEGARGSNGPAQASREAREASLEELVQTKVDRLSEKVRALGQVCNEARAVLADAERRHNDAIGELALAEETLQFIKEGPK